MPPKRKVKSPVDNGVPTEKEQGSSSSEVPPKVARLSTADPTHPDWTFKWTVTDVLSLDEKGRDSGTRVIKGLPWYVRVRTETSERTKHMKYLSLYLYCGETNDSTSWYADVVADFVLENRNISKNVREKFSYRFRAGLNNSGYASILSWSSLTDPLMGFVISNSLSLEVKINVLSVRGVKAPPILRDFTQHQPNFCDGTLTIEGKKLHISKQYLALHSPVFEALFFHGFKESSQRNVVLKDVNYESFVELLHVLYPSAKPVTSSSYRSLLKLADQFQIKAVFTHVERFLIDNKDISKATVLKYADQYNLFDAQNACIAQLRSTDDIKAVQGQRDYIYLSDPIKLMISEKRVKLTEKELKAS